MGVFQTYSGNAGAYRWNQFEKFNITLSNKKSTVFSYDESKTGSYDPTVSPFKIIFKTKKVKYDTDDDGQRFVSDGKLVKIIYQNLDGDKIAEFKGLSVDWAQLDNYISSGNTSKITPLIFGGGHKFIGVDNTELVPSGAYTEGDTLPSGWGNDTLIGKEGNDYFSDAGGKDEYDGGAWSGDQLSYADWYWNPIGMTNGIVANLVKGTVKGPDGYIDKIIGIEQIRGTWKKDKFIGDGEDNRFMGMGGADKMDGGAGFDMVRYDKDADQGGRSGIRVDLEAGTVRDGFRKVDKIVNIEAVRGTEKRDVMKDDANDNYFEGRGGNDVFTFTRGNDYSRGGDGFDTFIFKGADVGANVIRDFAQGEDKIQVLSVTGMGDLTLSYDAEGALVEFAAGSIRLDDIAEVTADFFSF